MKKESVWLLNIVLALLCLGVLMVYSATTISTYKEGDVYFTLWRQLKHVGIAMLFMLFFALFDYHYLQSRPILTVIMTGTVAMLVLVLFFGVEKFGARRWFYFAGMTFQPSEFAKLAAVIYLGAKLSANQDKLRRIGGYFGPLVVTGLLAVLVFAEDDLGTPVLIGAVSFLMLFMAGARWRHNIPTVLLGVSGTAALCAIDPERTSRMTTFLDPWKDPEGAGFQLIQSLAAFARGAGFGRGPGAGEQKLQYIFAAESDFIFANIGEEMGLMGTMLILVLFVLFLLVGFRIARCARDLLGTLLASGLVSLIAMQAALNMAVTTGAAPTKGLPLPFISAGGSALMANLAMVGILLNIGLQGIDREERV